MADPEQGQIIEHEWRIHLALRPTEDGRFVAIGIELRKPSSRLPTYINSLNGIDMLFERVQAELNNALRQVVNDIHREVIEPARRRANPTRR